ncbi:MAG: hypothetical protein R3F42_15095 [Pseudomonadota bacterium]
MIFTTEHTEYPEFIKAVLEPISKLENPAAAMFLVIPAQAGIQYCAGLLDARLRGHDEVGMLVPIVR